MDLTTIYLICFGVGLVFAVVSIFVAEVFGGHDAHDGHAETGLGGHHMPGLSIFSPTTIGCFVTAAGGLGLIFSRIAATHSAWLSAPLALTGGVGVASFVVFVFNKIFQATQSSSEGRVSELFGQNATVITPIAEGGVGEIAYVQGGTRYTAAARTLDDTPVASGTTVRIVRSAGTHFYVTSD